MRRMDKTMSQTITINVPDSVFQPIQRVALATNQPVEQLLLKALQASLPSLEELPPEVVQNLTVLETLDDEALWEVMLETVSTEQSEQIHDLLERQQDGQLSETEIVQLEQLQHQADLAMLRKGRAAVLLRFRGKRIPTLAELDQLSGRSK